MMRESEHEHDRWTRGREKLSGYEILEHSGGLNVL